MKNTLEEIAAKIREFYPDAASVELFVNYRDIQIDVKYTNPEKDGISMRSLNGEWIKS